MEFRKRKVQSEDYYPNCDMSIWLRSCVREVIRPVPGTVRGEIPKWIHGCLLRNGPGRLTVGESEFRHLFDCSALLHRFCIKNGEVTYQNRYLQSSTLKRNLSAMRIVVTEFGTQSVPDPCQTIFQRVSAVFQRAKDKSDNAMISIYPFGDEYFAMTEYPVVHRIDPTDLSTTGRVNLKDKYGIINHTSHPHITQDGTVYNLGVAIGKTGPKYCILEFPKGEAILENVRIAASIPTRWKLHPGYMHTFGITDNFFVVVEQPLSVSVPRVVVNTIFNRPLAESLKWYPEAKTVIYLISRKSGRISHTFDSESFFYLHTINQYEEGDHVVLDICCYKNPSMLDCMYIDALKVRKLDHRMLTILVNGVLVVRKKFMFQEGHKNADYATKFRGRPLRFVLPLNPSKATGNVNRLPRTKSEAHFLDSGRILVKPELLCSLGCETPRINYDEYSGKKYRYFYAISSDVDLENPGTLIKVDVRTKTKKTWCDDNIFPSEPIFVPKPNAKKEDDGIVLSALIWGRDMVNQVGLLVLDARTWKEIGRAVFITDGPVPKCLHGWFIDDRRHSTRVTSVI